MIQSTSFISIAQYYTKNYSQYAMAIHLCPVMVYFFSHNKLNVAIKFSQRPWFDYKSGADDIGAEPPNLQEMPWRQLRGGAKTGPLGSW